MVLNCYDIGGSYWFKTSPSECWNDLIKCWLGRKCLYEPFKWLLRENIEYVVCKLIKLICRILNKMSKQCYIIITRIVASFKV